ncbi:MAG: nickel pincer cofactor biosynthesis protein LarB [Kiritimatiellia bacterium]
MEIASILKQVEKGEISTGEAEELIISSTELDLGFARVDTDRVRRCGIPEVIYCPGKTAAQVTEIMTAMRNAGQDVLATKADASKYAEIRKVLPSAEYHETAEAITLDVAPRREPVGMVAVISAGTSDARAAEEAALTAERMGANVTRIADVGIAGLHRLLKHLDTLKTVRVAVVAAGMEGALPSVVGGLIDKPVVALPTSVGYGTSLGGISAMLAMLNSCVPGITVVNIDNGFGAGVAAALINRLGEKAA